MLGCLDEIHQSCTSAADEDRELNSFFLIFYNEIEVGMSGQHELTALAYILSTKAVLLLDYISQTE
jgi:hypothetical protein